LLQEVRAGRGIALELPDAAARRLIDAAAAALAIECRVVRLAASGPLGMSGFIAQLAGEADVSGQDDRVLEQLHARLTVPDVSGGRIVLLASGAGWLQRPVLRLLQHLSKDASALVLVLAGEPGWMSVLEGPDLAGLRAMLIRQEDRPVIDPPRVPPVRVPRTGRVWIMAGAGVAAGVAFGMWLSQTRRPSPAAPIAVAAPAPAAVPAQIASAPGKVEAATVEAPVAAATRSEAARSAPVESVPAPTVDARASADPAFTRATSPEPVRRRVADEPARHAPLARSVVARPAPRPREPDPEPVPTLRTVLAQPPAHLPYIGTFMADRYGVRHFQFGPGEGE